MADDTEHHGLRNFLLFLTTFGIAWVLWRERDQLKNRLNALSESDDPIADRAPEPEPDHSAVIVDVAAAEQLLDELNADEFAENHDFGDIEDDRFEPVPVKRPKKEPQLKAKEEPLPEELPVEPADDEAAISAGIDDLDDDPHLSAVTDEEEIAEPSDEPELPEADDPGLPTESEPVKPVTWVRPVDGECPEGYPVKARFATGHFHEPGDRGYDKIIPDCCYATVEEAEGDGFTASRWS